ncbi:DUF2255 family protein [Pseudomonas syringae group genomosp. 3]|uniref:DUF2255 family protein n=1 Tax=Pseudomonas syringae group genomosp. 3 TaxID=251701 RepID=UPI0009BAFE18|nr:DUF2255 family protein [Pseudomonas syringae group genomosp. 3]
MIATTQKLALAVALLAATSWTAPQALHAAEASAATQKQLGSSAEKKSTGPEWSADELELIIKADDLKVSPFREDGVTYGTPTWIWCVSVDGALYVRAYNGQASSWYKAAVREKAGQIIAAGMTRKVTFEPAVGPINDRIDDAYRHKYASSPYLDPMIGERARAATVRIIPTDR